MDTLNFCVDLESQLRLDDIQQLPNQFHHNLWFCRKPGLFSRNVQLVGRVQFGELSRRILPKWPNRLICKRVRVSNPFWRVIGLGPTTIVPSGIVLTEMSAQTVQTSNKIVALDLDSPIRVLPIGKTHAKRC